MYIKSTLLAGAFVLCAFAAPLPADDCEDVGPAPITADQLVKIAPATASCSGGEFATECADATTVADAINKSFETYKVTSKGEQAALIAYMLFESGNFKYNKNHFPFPGRAGQGTRMMAMPGFVEKYATAVAGADAVAKIKSDGGDHVLDNILALVNSDEEKSAGSAAWFLTSTCTPKVREGLDKGSLDGWHAFLTDCVGTTAAEERDPIWTAAKQALLG